MVSPGQLHVGSWVAPCLANSVPRSEGSSKSADGTIIVQWYMYSFGWSQPKNDAIRSMSGLEVAVAAGGQLALSRLLVSSHRDAWRRRDHRIIRPGCQDHSTVDVMWAGFDFSRLHSPFGRTDSRAYYSGSCFG